MAVGPCSAASTKASVTDNGYIYQVRSFCISFGHQNDKNLAMSTPSYQLYLGIFGHSDSFSLIIILDGKY